MRLDRKIRPRIALAPDERGVDADPVPSLTLGRAHEVTGPSALVFAAMVAGRLEGPILWTRPSWAATALHPEGCSPFFDPSRLVIAAAPRPLDALWTAEEALRSGAAPLVVAETTEPPALTPLRRLQLAAEAGGEASRGAPPLCLIISPTPGTAGAVESRWFCEPEPAWREGAPARWRFARTYAKAAPPCVWRSERSDAPNCEIRWKAA